MICRVDGTQNAVEYFKEAEESEFILFLFNVENNCVLNSNNSMRGPKKCYPGRFTELVLSHTHLEIGAALKRFIFKSKKGSLPCHVFQVVGITKNISYSL